ncbi:MAG: DUF262 domain-containing HNH endonuclease family protein [Gemmatimonadota bacterium]|nr:DUF262 domain-containing HNH endonuclease family protein [Gemmatimonadota bacterium]MDE2871964.1 DUF262 domain-containing HNH endonuclease family protein [Gemmatimonadota bacterium]
MKAKETPFFALFNQNVQYLVPRWQRRYVWGETQIDRLIEDMLAIAEAENQARPHYGGTLITVQESISPVMMVYRVVDGQQRLTTVSILLACIADTLAANGADGDLNPEEIRDDLLTNPEEPEDRRRKLRLQDGDEDEFRRIIEGDSPESSDGHVADAWRIVRKRVNSDNVQSLIKGLHRLRVITIVLDDRDDAQQIFQSLNATGKPLTEGEKVKNWLLMGLSEDVQTDLHREHWLATESVLGARHDAERIDVFLRDVMRWRTGRLVAGSGTYDEFRRWAIRREHDNPERRPELCAEVASLACLYGQLTGTAAPPPSKGVKRELDHLRAMGIDAHRPFTLRLLSDAQRAGESGRDPKWLVHTLGSVSSWITRLWLAGHSFTGLGKAFVELAAATVPADEVDPAQFWKRRIAEVPDRIAVPTDSAVTDGIRLTSKYGGKDTRATRAVLCAINDPRGWSKVSCDELTVEHIMPQKLTDEWRADLGGDRAEEIHGRHLHRLGNLTLCGLEIGAALGAHSFEKKKELYKKTEVLMTERVADFPRWDEDAIRRRAEQLAREALKLWPWTGGQ